MIDVNRIFSDKENLLEGLKRKGYEAANINKLEQLLLKQKEVNNKIEALRQKRNLIQKDKNISNEEKREVRDEIIALEQSLNPLKEEITVLLLDIPNTPDFDAPIGKGESDNVVISEAKSYYKCKTDNPLPHWEIAKKLDILDIELASKVSGSMFAFFKGKGAKLLRSLITFALSLNEDKYTEFVAPHLVNSKTLSFTGHLPKFADEQYKASQDDLWLIPTGEVPLTSGFSNTLFKDTELPKRVMGYTVCFRREAGSAGKDTRGLQRLHEFHKLELVKIVRPEDCKLELKGLLDDCLAPIKALKLQYRIVDLCTGDMGDKYGRCYDIEVYSPGVKKWLEVSSVGHFSDYQARRAGIRFSDGLGKKGIAYTLNGSGLASPRVFSAILEAYQMPDGSVKVPEALVALMGIDKIENKGK